MLQGPCLCSEGAYAQSLIARPNSSLGVGKKGKRGEFRTALEVPKRRKSYLRYGMRQVYACLLRLSAPELMLVPIDPFFLFARRYGGFSFGMDVINMLIKI